MEKLNQATFRLKTVFELHCRDYINRHAISDKAYIKVRFIKHCVEHTMKSSDKFRRLEKGYIWTSVLMIIPVDQMLSIPAMDL
ncbi:unnamed protein product [Strongylus vulgaris]|uniref:Uncharacterized protein n=1 Tax=Strongylus vulgaris TaxID=40348 RepID=A0A3P7L1U8_STRVU|nr:unnamed protein product [Strongylus vulgaris]